MEDNAKIPRKHLYLYTKRFLLNTMTADFSSNLNWKKMMTIIRRQKKIDSMRKKNFHKQEKMID